MAFFRPHVFSPYAAQQQQPVEPSFHGLFRLLEDWDNHHNTNTHSEQPTKRTCQRVARRQQPTFTPRFDVQETESAYELHGELAGVHKKDINIEFSDPQTLVIRGRVERSSTTTQDAEENLLTSASIDREAGGNNDDEDEAVLISHDTEDTSSQHGSETATSQRSFKATVEDDLEDNIPTSASASAAEKDTNSQHGGRESNSNISTTTSPAAGASARDAAQVQPQQTSTLTTEQQTKPAAKFWISERSVGTFSRTFEFPERIEIDNVSAGLENGILSLRVPKAKKFGARTISVL